MPSAQTQRKSTGAVMAAAMPSSVEPMLPTPVKLPFSDPAWLFEPKWDGYRALCFLKDGKVRFISRNHRNLTQRFPELQEIQELIKAKAAIIDGEIVALDRRGKPSFEALRFHQRRGAIEHARIRQALGE
jgi:bifunctional non-homologous end joining protein LigD